MIPVTNTVLLKKGFWFFTDGNGFETWKSWASCFEFWNHKLSRKSHLLWFALSDKIHLLSFTGALLCLKNSRVLSNDFSTVLTYKLKTLVTVPPLKVRCGSSFCVSGWKPHNGFAWTFLVWLTNEDELRVLTCGVMSFWLTFWKYLPICTLNYHTCSL